MLENKCEYGIGNKYKPDIVICKKQDPCDYKINFGNIHYCKIPLQEKRKGLEKEL